MSTHKYIDIFCFAALFFSVLLCGIMMKSEELGVQAEKVQFGYESTLFDTSKVHTIDIIIDDWDDFIDTALSEEYSLCTVVIDGEPVKNIGIRCKGNTSLTTVAGMEDSDRFSFKVEFDHYDSGKTYYGLDKLVLNNSIQDNTYMKDYLCYQLMGQFGVPSPLCSYAYLTVNGEDFGLYLAVEAIEESFLQRNYGSDYGELYKPESMNQGGRAVGPQDGQQLQKDLRIPEGDQAPEGQPMPGGHELPNMSQRPNRQMPADGTFTGHPFQREIGEDMGAKGSAETKLQYIDDDPASYSTIFDSAKTDPSPADQMRLINALNKLSKQEDLETVLDIDSVMRYFIVHNYVVNGDSYTGSIIHNYYLYEEYGQLSMLPWDYNLAFGSFQNNNAASGVDDAIDTVLSDRPMQSWIFSSESYRQQYYQLYADFLNQLEIESMIEEVRAMIAPYVEQDSTAFCTYEQFETSVNELKEFCLLRSQSVQLQIDGYTEQADSGI